MARQQISPSHISIQSFYSKEVRGEKEVEQASPSKAGDGFTEEELADALDPLNRKWNPQREYEESPIDQLTPGPRAVTFAGRIVYINSVTGRSQKQPKASGWHNLIIKDDSTAISVKLYFANKQYPLKLGQLLTLWTVFISDASKADTSIIPGIKIYANLFPGRVTSDHVMIHATDSAGGICRMPLGYRKGQPLHGLMTLDSYIGSGGHDGVTGVKLLVCVKSIGAKKRISKKAGGESDLADVILFDHTGDVKITLWNDVIESAKEWQAGKTILLISNPGWIVSQFSAKGKLGITRGAMIEVDPEFADGEWLRKYASGLTKKEAVCVEFPREVWDLEATKSSPVRILFTLRDIDEWVRADPQQVFSGWINVVILEMSLVSLHRCNMLMCAECCGVPIYSNSITTPCRNCSKTLSMTPNPRIIGTIADETGCIAAGKLLWSNDAWKDIFDRTPEEMTMMTPEEIRLFESRVLFMRMHLVFGWVESVGRLAIVGMGA